MLDATPWPEMVVVVARSVDVWRLDLSLHTDAPVTTTLRFSQLVPALGYRFGTDSVLVADGAGRAEVLVTLDGRHDFVLEPQP